MDNRTGLLLFVFLMLAPVTSWAQSGVDVLLSSQKATEKPAMRLSLKQAVDIALAPEGNTRIQLAEEIVRQAEARSAQSRAALLPDLESSIGQQNQTRNLAALGIRVVVPVAGFTFPQFVGPFSTFDARATATQSIFDFSAIRRFQASRLGVRVAREESDSTRDQVAGQVAKLYLAALRANALLETAQANVTLAEALLKLANDQKAAGTGTGLEVTRARTQLANERQRLLAADNERTRAHLQLLKAMDMELSTTIELSDKLAMNPVENVRVEHALAVALESRADYKAQLKRSENARLNHSATKLERLPSIAGFADYGSIGSSINHAVPTRTYGLSVRIPVFDGGRGDARRSESLSQLRQEQIKERDLREEIELEIRQAMDSLHSAQEQVKVSEEGLALAESELAQARRRYQAGMASSLEVTDAQTRLARARDNQIAALFNYNQARVDMGQAMGTIRRMIQ